MCNHSVRLHRLALCAFMALAAWSTAQAAGDSPYDFAPLPTTTIDPDLGYEAKLDLGSRGGASDSDGGVAASVGGCDSIGAFNSQFTGSLRYRGNLIRVTQNDVILREIKMVLAFTGPADLYVSIHKRDSQTGTYSRFMTNDIIISKDGTGITEFVATEELINGGNGIALPPGDYAIAFAWGSTPITFAHDGLTYPRSFQNGSVLGSVALNIPIVNPPQPPVSDNLPALQVFTGGAYAMELCFVPLPGACCSGGSCQDKLESQCTGAGSFFHGQRTTCAETPCEYGACCTDKCGGCKNEYTPEACAAAGGRAHWLGAACPGTTTNLCPKVTGACCLADAQSPGGFKCDDKMCQSECVNAGGTYRGDGTDCARNICVGACCVTGGCLNRTQSACTGSSGTYKGNGTLCVTEECGGACCKGFTGLDFCDHVSSKTLCEYTPDGFPQIAYRGDGTPCDDCGVIADYSACCLPGGSCINTTASFCRSSWVQGTPCLFGQCGGVACPACPAALRCCFGDGSCQLLTSSVCTARGGTSVAAQTTCLPTACASHGGACCGMGSSACTMTTRAQCGTQGGFYQGDNSDCSNPAATCPGFGACCRSDGECFDDFSAADCALIAGTFEGPASLCFEPPVDCDERGACCTTTGGCLFIDPATCDEVSGAFHGEGVACAATSCAFGACCQPGGTCSNGVPAGACSGPGQTFHGGLLCADVQCIPPPQTGACCDGNTGVCTNDVLQQECQVAGTRYGGNGSTCATINPPCIIPSGACCVENTGVCTDNVREADCQAAGGRWGGACATLNPPCAPPPPTGACCNGGDCSFMTEAQCTSGGGTYNGDNSPCGQCVCTPSCTVIVSTHVSDLTADANCAIDARQPYLPGHPETLQGWSAITLTFDCGDTSCLVAGDFAVASIPSGTPPTVTTVTPNGSSLTVNLSGPIPPGAWTCVEYMPSGAKRCLGFLPGDANGDRTAAPVDILDIIDNLNGVRQPPLFPHQCDLDRSNLCAPADILTEIDLLNGASGFAVWNGKTLPACPSAAP